jgi:hypothetical protein
MGLAVIEERREPPSRARSPGVVLFAVEPPLVEAPWVGHVTPPARPLALVAWVPSHGAAFVAEKAQ